mgnify:CR=1 FL=1
MIHISRSNMYPGHVLDTMLRAVVPDAIGVSTGPYGTFLHLADDASLTHQNTAVNLLDNYGGLAVSTDKTSMNEGDVDPVITVSSGDAELGYIVLLDGDEYDSGAVSVITGTATLNLVSPVAGAYQIFVYRKTGNYASGSVTIMVNEV